MCSLRRAVYLPFTFKYFMETIIRLYKAHQQTLKLRHSEITALPKEGQKSWLQAVTEFLVSQICFQRTNTNIKISSQRVRDNVMAMIRHRALEN